MERNFDNRDFEQFLKQNADQYRMHPSEKVWTEIHNTLHTRRRWYGIAALLLLLTGAVVSGVMILHPGSNQTTASAQTKISTEPVRPEKIVAPQTTIPVLKNIKQTRSIASNKIPSIINDYVAEQSEPFDIISSEMPPVQQPALAVNDASKEIFTIITGSNEDNDLKVKSNFPSSVSNNDKAINDNSIIVINSFEKTRPAVKANQTAALISGLIKKAPADNAFVQKNSLRKKLEFQLYFTPGVSYRRLTENKEAILAASGGPTIPTNLALQDVKNVVTHKPDIGFELGLSAKYPLSKRVVLKTGFQFNVNKYNIHAFSYSGEQATIAIQGQGPAQQSVTSTSYYRNFNGYKPNWLTNVYFSFSIPVGAEVSFINTQKISVGLGLTLQPTYLLDNRAYLLSTDFKNYATVPDLIRPWNINTGAELIVSFKSGKTKWQIGPQVRYQALSSFKDKYPVKENLFNFGLKAGVSLNR